MQILDVPVFNEDGTVQFTQTLSPAEAKILLQFGLNYFAALGLHTRIVQASEQEAQVLTPKALSSLN
jgi:hypothetical protein